MMSFLQTCLHVLTSPLSPSHALPTLNPMVTSPGNSQPHHAPHWVKSPFIWLPLHHWPSLPCIIIICWFICLFTMSPLPLMVVKICPLVVAKAIFVNMSWSCHLQWFLIQYPSFLNRTLVCLFFFFSGTTTCPNKHIFRYPLVGSGHETSFRPRRY